MYPNGESIGIVLNQDDALIAQFALERVQANIEVHTTSAQASGIELSFPVADEEGCFRLDKETSKRIISVARAACETANQNLWSAQNHLLDRREDKADVEELQFISMEIASEQENIEQFEALFKDTEACLLESESIFIDKGLAKD